MHDRDVCVCTRDVLSPAQLKRTGNKPAESCVGMQKNGTLESFAGAAAERPRYMKVAPVTQCVSMRQKRRDAARQLLVECVYGVDGSRHVFFSASQSITLTSNGSFFLVSWIFVRFSSEGGKFAGRNNRVNPFSSEFFYQFPVP